MQERYFVEMPDGQRYGPADLETLRAWVTDRRVSPSTTLVHETTGERVRADAVPGLFAPNAGEAPPVTPGAPPSGSVGGSYVDPNFEAAKRKSRSTVFIVLAVLGGAGCCVLLILAAVLFPVFAQAKYAAQRTQGLSSMKQLATGVMIYSVDADDVFPPAMQSAASLKPYLLPYVKEPGYFLSKNPIGGDILGDKRLNRVSLTALPEPQSTIMLYDSLPWRNDQSLTGYTDGHVKFVPGSSLPSLLAPDPVKRAE